MGLLFSFSRNSFYRSLSEWLVNLRSIFFHFIHSSVVKFNICTSFSILMILRILFWIWLQCVASILVHYVSFVWLSSFQDMLNSFLPIIITLKWNLSFGNLWSCFLLQLPGRVIWIRLYLSSNISVMQVWLKTNESSYLLQSFIYFFLRFEVLS